MVKAFKYNKKTIKKIMNMKPKNEMEEMLLWLLKGRHQVVGHFQLWNLIKYPNDTYYYFGNDESEIIELVEYRRELLNEFKSKTIEIFEKAMN